MIPTMDQKPAQQLTWEQRLLKNAGKPKSSLKPEYQELKFTLHRKLLDKINLEALATIDNQRVRGEVRQALITLIDSEPTLLSSIEKQQICDEVLDEVFGLGPLEPLLQDPTISDILVNGCRQVYVERKVCSKSPSVTFRDDAHLIGSSTKSSARSPPHRESTPMVTRACPTAPAVTPSFRLCRWTAHTLHPRFSQDKLMPADLVEKRSLTPGMMELLEGAVKAHLNFIIIGVPAPARPPC